MSGHSIMTMYKVRHGNVMMLNLAGEHRYEMGHPSMDVTV